MKIDQLKEYFPIYEGILLSYSYVLDTVKLIINAPLVYQCECDYKKNGDYEVLFEGVKDLSIKGEISPKMGFLSLDFVDNKVLLKFGNNGIVNELRFEAENFFVGKTV